MSLLWGVCTSPGMLCSGSDSELCSSGHISTCSDQPLVAAGCAGYWFPSNPSMGMAWALRGPRGAAAPGFGGQEPGVGVSVGARVLTAAQGQSPAACLCAR